MVCKIYWIKFWPFRLLKLELDLIQSDVICNGKSRLKYLYTYCFFFLYTLSIRSPMGKDILFHDGSFFCILMSSKMLSPSLQWAQYNILLLFI